MANRHIQFHSKRTVRHTFMYIMYNYLSVRDSRSSVLIHKRMFFFLVSTFLYIIFRNKLPIKKCTIREKPIDHQLSHSHSDWSLPYQGRTNVTVQTQTHACTHKQATLTRCPCWLRLFGQFAAKNTDTTNTHGDSCIRTHTQFADCTHVPLTLCEIE